MLLRDLKEHGTAMLVVVGDGTLDLSGARCGPRPATGSEGVTDGQCARQVGQAASAARQCRATRDDARQTPHRLRGRRVSPRGGDEAKYLKQWSHWLPTGAPGYLLLLSRRPWKHLRNTNANRVAESPFAHHAAARERATRGAGS